MIIETCPKCGHDQEETVLTTNPPILVKRCLHCGWRWEWGQENITHIPFQDRIVKDINVPCKTNADKIRSMTDEELADFLQDIANFGGVNGLQKIMTWIEWMKQEVKVEHI